MTRLYGFTHNWLNSCVIGFGKRCLCFSVYLAKVPKRRLKGYCYVTKSEGVVFNMKYNSGDKFRFFGFVSIDKKDLMDE